MAFAQKFGIKILHFVSYNVQDNGQVEATNNIIIDLIRKFIEEKPRHWHDTLSQALWAIINTKNNATTMTPFWLTYGQYVLLRLEVKVKSLRVAKQHLLSTDDHQRSLVLELESVDEDSLMVYENIKPNKEKVA